MAAGGAKTQVDVGLTSALTALPVGHGYAQVFGGYDKPDGLYARAEIGYHIASNLGAFAFGEASQAQGVMAGAGVRVNF